MAKKMKVLVHPPLQAGGLENLLSITPLGGTVLGQHGR